MKEFSQMNGWIERDGTSFDAHLRSINLAALF